MKYLLLSVALLAFLPLFAQKDLPAGTGKGATPLAQSKIQNPKSSITRAVVIGISEYTDDRIPDLKYAHVDAQAFADYLRSPAGGSLPNDQLMLLTNAQATAGKIIAALTWLIEECKTGERAIIYFSGHGDVEQVTKFQRGYLLAHDSPGTTYMAGGSLPVGFLSDVITTLSDAGVEVVMVSDACRSGKLAGSANGGTQATSAALAQQFSKEIKILSCQPEEFSLEGEQWGGGRGCFSFHLVDALTGMADGNADGSVSLLEAGRYLEDRVPAETAPHSQIPMTVGNRSTTLATVQPDALAALQGRRAGKVSTLSPIDAKGFEDMVLAKTDTSVQRLYAAFTAALERGDLMSPPGASANGYYGRLLPQPGIEKLKGLMTRNLAAALQDEAQVVINQLLRTDPAIVDDAFSPVSKYDHLPGYLHRAGELLGEGHYMWRFIKVREYYFKAKACRKENYPELTPESLLYMALASLDTALTFDEEAAYVYFEKGYLLFFSSFDKKGAAHYFELAVQLSSEWVLPTYFAGRALGIGLNKEKGLTYLKKAISLDSLFLPTYWTIGAFEGAPQDSLWFEAYVKKMERYVQEHPGKVPVTYYNYLGNSLLRLKRFEEAEQALLKGAELSNHQHPLIYMNLGFVYRDMGRYDDAEKAFQKLISLLPLSSEGYDGYAYLKYLFQKKPLEAIPYYQKAIQYGADDYEDLFMIYLHTNQIDSAEALALQYVAAFPNDSRTRQRLGQLYLHKGMKEQAREQFELMTTLQPNRDDYYAYFPIIAYTQLGKADSLPALLETARLQANDHPRFYFMAACGFAFNGQNDLALQWLEGAFQRGWNCFLPECSEPWYSLESPDLFYLRQTPEYKALVKKYFPDQFKD